MLSVISTGEMRNHSSHVFGPCGAVGRDRVHHESTDRFGSRSGRPCLSSILKLRSGSTLSKTAKNCLYTRAAVNRNSDVVQKWMHGPYQNELINVELALWVRYSSLTSFPNPSLESTFFVKKQIKWDEEICGCCEEFLTTAIDLCFVVYNIYSTAAVEFTAFTESRIYRRTQTTSHCFITSSKLKTQKGIPFASPRSLLLQQFSAHPSKFVEIYRFKLFYLDAQNRVTDEGRTIENINIQRKRNSPKWGTEREMAPKGIPDNRRRSTDDDWTIHGNPRRPSWNQKSYSLGSACFSKLQRKKNEMMSCGNVLKDRKDKGHGKA